MKYRTIVADPPWPYPEGFASAVATGRSQNRNRDGAKALVGARQCKPLPYKAMSLDEIRALPFCEWRDKDCRLFLWTTNKWLPAAFGLLTDWGFIYRQTLVWHKAETGPWVTSVAPNTAEFLLVGSCGSVPRTGAFPSQVLRVPAVRTHSTKPDVFLDHIEQVSPGPYLELFARRARFAWDYWGDESLNTAEVCS